jgi:hypothetical protein
VAQADECDLRHARFLSNHHPNGGPKEHESGQEKDYYPRPSICPPEPASHFGRVTHNPFGEVTFTLLEVTKIRERQPKRSDSH